MMLKNTTLAIAVAVALTACGGGSGTALTDPSTTSTAATLAGGAAKGIVKQGLVTAIELDGNGGELREVGSATTDDNGEYSLTLSSDYQGGAVLIKLKAGANTTMVCDALNGCAGKNRGEEVTLPADFELTAITPPADSGEKVSLQVTPFSHMAAANAKKSLEEGVAAEKAVSDAIGRVNDVTGLDITRIKPVDITATDIASKSVQEQRYALLNAAFADVAYAGNADNLVASLEKYAQEFKDGDFDIDDAGQEGDLTALLNNLQAQAQSPSVAVSTESKSDVTGYITLTNGKKNADGSFTPKVNDNSDKTEVEKAKALITEARTWVSSFDSLKSPAAAFETDANVITSTLNTETNAVIEVAVKGIDAALGAIITSLKNNTTLPQAVQVGGSTINIDEVVSTGKTLIKLSSSNLAGVVMDFTVDIDKERSEVIGQPLHGKTITVDLAGSAKNAKVQVAATDATLKVTFAPSTSGSVSSSSSNAVPSSVDLNGDINLSVLSNGVATGESLVGKGLISLVALNAGVAEGWRTLSGDDALSQLSLKQLKLDDVTLKSTATGNTTDLSVNLVLDNAASLDTLAYLQNGKSIWVNNRVQGDNFGFTSYDHGLTKLDYGTFNKAYSCDQFGMNCYPTGGYVTQFSGVNAAGMFSVVDKPGDVLGLMPKVVKKIQPANYVNSIEKVNVFYSGSETRINALLGIKSKEMADSFLKGSVTIGANMALKGLPAADVAVTFDRTGFKAGSVTTKLSYNGRMLDITATKADADNGSGTITVTNASAVAMVLTVADGAVKSGTISVDKKSVGTISKTNGLTMIRYNDGTFESL